MKSEKKYRTTFLYVESKKKWYTWAYLQNRNTLTDLANELTLVRGKDGRKGKLGSLECTCPAAVFKKDDQQGPTAQHKKLLSYTAASKGGEFWGERIHVHMWLSTFAETITTSLINYTLI